MSTPFLRDEPWNFAHVFNLPLPNLLRFLFFFVGGAGNVDPLRSNYPKKTKPQNIWRKKNTHTHTSKRLGRGTLNTCANFRVHLSKTAWTLGSEVIWGYMVEPACTTSHKGRWGTRWSRWWSVWGVNYSTTPKPSKTNNIFCFVGDYRAGTESEGYYRP